MPIRIRIAWLMTVALLTVAPLVRADEPAGAVRSLVVSGQGYFPVALRLADGRIAVVLRGGGPHLSIKGRLDMVCSDDDGKTWGKPMLVVDSELDDRNPAFGQAADGTLVVGYWRTANYDANGRWNAALEKHSTHVVRSTDGGKTWSEPSEIDVREIGFGSPYGRILTLPDGAMLMAVYGGAVREQGGGKAAPKGACSFVYRSTDAGRTWARFATPGPERFNETGLLRLRSGDLLAAMRTEAPHGDVWVARSTDAGKSWGEPYRLTGDRVHPADLVQLPDDRVLLVAGDRRKPYGVVGLVGPADGKLDAAGGFTLVDTAINTDCGYPSSVVLKDGRVLTVYYATGDKGHPEWGTHAAAVVYEVPKK